MVKRKVLKMPKKWKWAPLSSSLMLVSMLGFMFSVVYTSSGRLPDTWGFTLGLFFAILFIGNIFSMTKAPVEEELYLDHHIDHPKKKALRKKKTSKR
jgi:hypothetical protein